MIYPPFAGMLMEANVIDTLSVAPAQPAPAPCVMVAVTAPWSVPVLSYSLALYMLPAIVSAESTHIFIARFDELTTVVSQLVIWYWNAKVCVVQAFEPPCVITCRLSLFVGGGMGVIVKVGVTVAVRVLVKDRLMVGVTVGVYICLKSGQFPVIKSSDMSWWQPP
jgi:hypothetical protein